MARLTAVLLAGAALALVPAASAASFRVTLTAPTHTPRVNAKGWYTVHTRNLQGRLIRATLTAQIVDPFGGAHPVAYDNTKQNIVARPFNGVFGDYIQFPADSKGFRLTVPLHRPREGREDRADVLDPGGLIRSTRATVPEMAREITQRQPRNESGEIMRALDRGESFVITRNGVPVGELLPLRRRHFVPAPLAIAAFAGAPSSTSAGSARRSTPTSIRAPDPRA
jgi:antitoxin (DNA-binding transcriptional repressor) of toxin-antitoxin stability system